MLRKFTIPTDDILYEILQNLKLQSALLSALSGTAIEISSILVIWQYDKGTNNAMSFTDCPMFPFIRFVRLYDETGTPMASSIIQNGNDFTLFVNANSVTNDKQYRLDLFHGPYQPEPVIVKPDIEGVSLFGYKNQIYDGSKHRALDSFTGTIEGDVILASFDGENFNNYQDVTFKNVTEKTLFVKIQREGYNDFNSELTVSILKKPLSIEVVSKSFVYDGMEHFADWTNSGLGTGDNFDSCPVVGSGIEIGVHPVTIGPAGIVDSDNVNANDNYDITYIDGTVTITSE